METNSRIIKRLPFGYVNGHPAFSRDEFIFLSRSFGPIEDDAYLVKYAEKVTSGWQSGGWTHRFADFYLSDYAMSEPYASLTNDEFRRLEEIQKLVRETEEAAEKDHQWKHMDTLYWADNSIEEVWEDRFGNRKTVQVAGPCGDTC